MLSSHATSFLSRCHLEGEHERRGGYVSTRPPSVLVPHPGRQRPRHGVSAAPGGHEEQASAGPWTAPENQEGGRTLGHHLSPAGRAPAKGPIRDTGASFPSVTPTDQSALHLPTGPRPEDVPPGQDRQTELQADGLTAERWEALHPVPPTHLCVQPVWSEETGTAACSPGETGAPQEQAQQVRPCPWGAQARFASYPETWPHPTHGESSVLGPHWPSLLRMTRGRWTNKRVGKTAGPRLPGRPHHDSNSRSGVLTRLKLREVRGDAGRKQGSLYCKPSDYLQSHAPSAAGCRPGGAGRDGTPRARVTLIDLQSPLFTGAWGLFSLKVIFL